MSAAILYNLALTAETANGNSADLSVGSYIELAIDTNITIVSGSSPTLQLFLDRKGADGVYYPLWQSIVVVTPTQISTSVGAGLAYNQGFGATVRFHWVITGTTPSFTFSVSIQAK